MKDSRSALDQNFDKGVFPQFYPHCTVTLKIRSHKLTRGEALRKTVKEEILLKQRLMDEGYLTKQENARGLFLSLSAKKHFQCFQETLKGSVGTNGKNGNKSANQNVAYVCMTQ